MEGDERTDIDPSEQRRRPPRKVATLSFRDGTGARAVEVAKRTLIGSSADVDVSIRDAMVSRLHAELVPADDGVWIRDLGSRNGTFVNDVAVKWARLPHRGRLRLGMTEVLVSYERAERPPAPLHPSHRFGRLLGESIVMRELFAMLEELARSNASVLIRGETGTGKELVAEAIHAASPRADKPFVIIDCSALPENLLEAELFGHARGAFTGAVSARAGAFEEADGGTVFIDEIGELPLSMQPKLLRVLESRTVRRVGETQQRAVDVRVVTATHRDLEQMVARGEFREDLYFRVGVVPVFIPPLRERPEDIALLAGHFLGDAPVDPELMQWLSARAFRGNVRELRNIVERVRAIGLARVLSQESSSEPQPADLAGIPALVDGAPDLSADYPSFREQWIALGERRYIEALLERHGGNVASAAKAAGVARSYVYRMLKRTRGEGGE